MVKEYLATQTWVMDQIKRFAGGGNLGELAVFNDIILPMEFDISYLKNDNTITGTAVNKDGANRQIEVRVDVNYTRSYDISVSFVSKSAFNLDKWIDMGYKYLHIEHSAYPTTASGPNYSSKAGDNIYLVDGSNPSIVLTEGYGKLNIEPLKGRNIKIKILAGGSRSSSSPATDSAYNKITGWTLTAL